MWKAGGKQEDFFSADKTPTHCCWLAGSTWWHGTARPSPVHLPLQGCPLAKAESTALHRLCPQVPLSSLVVDFSLIYQSLPLRINFANFSHNCRRSQPFNKYFIPYHIPDLKRYRHKMERFYFSNWNKSLISTFLLVKLLSKWTWHLLKYHFRILFSIIVDFILRRC